MDEAYDTAEGVRTGREEGNVDSVEGDWREGENTLVRFLRMTGLVSTPLAWLIFASHCPLTESIDLFPLTCPEFERPFIPKPSPITLPESDLFIAPSPAPTILATFCLIGVEGGEAFARAASDEKPLVDETDVEWE